jgi:hypothetical protein
LLSVLLPIASTAQSFSLDSTMGLQPHGVQIKAVSYQGRKAVQVLSSPESDAAWAKNHSGTGGGIVVLPGVRFHNGAIEISVAGKPGAPHLAFEMWDRTLTPVTQLTPPTLLLVADHSHPPPGGSRIPSIR